ncbi:hypothetical protein [Flexibacterium corallicola]|uniref:hypothetical protein n=1 Tax=Flexibacterium corallicola TaxID=3037259 RepID=UPI00286EEAB4|nr:hypothetical protein [Pseudovibrio sp. M1P-2-3]
MSAPTKTNDDILPVRILMAIPVLNWLWKDTLSRKDDIFLVRILMLIPLFGWLLTDAIHGKDDAKYFFVVNVGVTWFLAIAFFGYPAIIIPALCLVASAFIWILSVCR